MIKRTERGWPGHFIGASDCLFRRNTLLESNSVFIVVSTVGNFIVKDKTVEIGYKRYYETMVFYSNETDDRYHDADVSHEISVNGKWSINELGQDIEADTMHERVVDEILNRLSEAENKTTI